MGLQQSEQEALAALRVTAPRLSSEVEAHLNLPLSMFLKRQWTTTLPKSSLSEAAFSLFLKRFKTLLHTQLPERDVFAALEDFIAAPVVQTGPHSDLFLDPTAFHTMIFSALGAQAASRKYVFTYTCGSVTFETKAKFGPGWIGVESYYLNLFGLSRKKLARSTVSAYRKPVQFAIPDLKEIRKILDRQPYLGDFLNLLPADVFPCAEAAFEAANHALWKSWGGEDTAKLVTICDDFYADLLADFLDSEYQVFDRLMFTQAGRDRLNAVVRSIKASDAGFFFSEATDFFWLLREGRFRPMRVYEDTLRESCGGSEAGESIPLDRRHIVAALRDRKLMPNLLLIYAASSIIPQIRALGGLRLLGYYPLYHRCIRDVLETGEPAERDLYDELSADPQLGWCMAIKVGGRDPFDWMTELSAGEQVDALVRKFGAESLRSVTDGLVAFHRHPEWGQLVKAVVL